MQILGAITHNKRLPLIPSIRGLEPHFSAQSSWSEPPEDFFREMSSALAAEERKINDEEIIHHFKRTAQTWTPDSFRELVQLIRQYYLTSNRVNADHQEMIQGYLTKVEKLTESKKLEMAYKTLVFLFRREPFAYIHQIR